MDPLRLLIVDDQHPDAELSARQIAAAGYRCTWRRVETEHELREQLVKFSPHLILSDFTLPRYDGLSALALALREAPQIPFIFVSGSIGDQRAADALVSGATDYVPKADRTRLIPAVTRALAGSHLASGPQATPAERIPRLGAALQMLSGMRAAALDLQTRTALLKEACRIIHGANQYEYSFIVLPNLHTHTAHVVAWAGAGAVAGAEARFPLTRAAAADTSVVGRVLRTGQMVLCLDIEEYSGTISAHERGAAAPGSSFVALPLPAAGKPLGVLMIGVAKSAHLSEQELMLLEALATQISSALQTLPEEHTVQTLAQLDPLTGLPRREFFCRRLEHFLASRSEAAAVPTVAVFDIEHLGDVNDAHGRHVGDHLLQGIADRLKRRFGGSSELAYFGAGTFAAVFAECRASRAEMDPATAVFGHPFAIGDRPVTITVTVKCGLAHYGAPATDAETLLQHAEAALAKNRGRHDPVSQSPRRASAADSSGSALERRLRHALEDNEFLLRYQPLVDALSGRIVAVEALLRWQDPDRGMIPPGAFLPVLERSGLMADVGEWILTRAARDCAGWHSTDVPAPRVAVNLSSTQLGRKHFAAYFLDTVRRELGPNRIDIEITESALIKDVESLRADLQMLRSEGVRVAIDDFGMGHSSLTRLCELPVDALKIDRSFTSRLTHQPQSQAIVAAIIALAKAYALHTVAVGVETREQLQIVNALGCELSQGYLHSPPISAEAIELIRKPATLRLQTPVG